MPSCPNCGRSLPNEGDRFCPYCGAVVPTSSPGPPPPAPPPALESPPGPSGGTPWERRAEIGAGTALVETTKEVLLAPTAFFQAMPVSGGIGAPLGYAVILGYLGVVAQAVYQAVFRVAMGTALSRFETRGELGQVLPWLEGGAGFVMQLVLGPLFVVLGLFIGAGVYHLMLLILGGARRDFEATFRVAAYGHAISVFLILPICGSLIGFVWWLVVVGIGLSEAHGIGRGKAFTAVLLPLVLICCCCAGVVALIAGSAGFLAGLTPR
jgi:hypothetical protein